MTTATDIPHGTLTGAKTHRCTCDACRARAHTYDTTRARLIAYGRWQPYIDAEPVRQHLRMLMSYGIGWMRVGRLTGLSNGALSKLLYGDSTRGMAPSKRVRPATADKILAIRPTFDALAPSARVDATGTRRRLQALVAVGWPQRALAPRLGISREQVNEQIHRLAEVEVATVRAVIALYDQLWDVDPVQCGIAPRWAEHARRLAKRNGWAPPAAWDDATIDSPAAEPDLGESVDRYSAIAEDAQWLMDAQGYTREQAALRLGITQRHLDRALAHARQAEAEVA